MCFFLCRLAKKKNLQANQDIAPNSRGEVDFGLEIQLDAQGEGGVFGLAVGVDWSFEEASYFYFGGCEMMLNFLKKDSNTVQG